MMNDKLYYRLIFTLLMLLGAVSSQAQTYRVDRYVGIQLGSSLTQYIGDLTPRKANSALWRNSFQVGLYKRLTPHWGLRGNVSVVRIFGDDFEGAHFSTLQDRLNYLRNQSFSNTLVEGAVMLQYDILKNTGHYSKRRKVNPYVFGGIGFYRHNPLGKTPEIYGGTWVRLQPLGTEGQGRGMGNTYNLNQFSVPFGVGVNYKISNRVNVGFELTFRKTFTDYLDDVSGSYVDKGVFGDNQLAAAMSDRTNEAASAMNGSSRNLASLLPDYPERSYVSSLSGQTYTTRGGYHPDNFDNRRGDKRPTDNLLNFGFTVSLLLSKNKPLVSAGNLYTVNTQIENAKVTAGRNSKDAAFYAYQDRYLLETLAINTEYSDMMATFYKNGILFVSDKPDKRNYTGRRRGSYYNFYYSPSGDIYKNEITQPVIFEELQYLRYNYFAAASTRGSAEVIFTMFEEADNTEEVKRQKLYKANAVGENIWQNIALLPFSSNDYSVSQPCISRDGQRVYFVSDAAGGFGGTDIYVSYNFNGNWTYPQNLGAPVNTPGNEMFPFIHDDGNLYFTSDGHYGMGGLDVYEAILEGEKYVRVANVGAPVNSAADDFGLILDDVKRVGFFSSNRAGGKGGNDIYKIVVESINRSRKLTDETTDLIDIRQMQLLGLVKNKKTNAPIPFAIVKLRNSITDEIKILRSDENGEFTFPIRNDGLYEVGTSVMGYLPMPNSSISTVGMADQDSINVLIELEPITYTFIIRGIVKNNKNEEPVEGVEVVLLDLENDTQISVLTDDKGRYKLDLKQDRDYVIFVSEKGYKPKEYNISTYNKTSSETLIVNIGLDEEK